MKMIKKINILTVIFLWAFTTLVNAESSVAFSDSRIQSRMGEATEGGGLVIHFDPRLLEVTNVVVDSTVWRFINKNGDINNGEGSVADILFSSYQGVSGDAKIATVEFKSLKKGRGDISLQESEHNPFASAGEKVSVSFESTKIRIRR